MRWRISQALCWVFVGLALASRAWGAPDGPVFLREGWRLQTSLLARENGDKISQPDFKTDSWYEAAVPTTVLNALVRNAIYPDPYVGMNNVRIPDASDEFNRAYGLSKFTHLPGGQNPWADPWWFRKVFQLPADFRDKMIWLTFEGINYRAEIWLNGRKIAGSHEVVGMFGRWIFNITGIAVIDKDNAVAVKIFPLDFPGLPAEPQLKAFGPFGLNGGPTGDIGKNVTMHCSVGWDWIPAVRDRNMGIWQDVKISATGPVDIRDIHVITNLSLPDVSSANIRVKADVVNISNSIQDGVLTIRLSPRGSGPGEIALIKKEIKLGPRETLGTVLDPEGYPELRVKNPLLWWPNGLGRPDLYEMALDLEIGGRVSKMEKIFFGIREVSSQAETMDGWDRRNFFVNGVRIPVRGAAWVPDMMLNHSPDRLRSELRLWKEANLNLVRIWGGGTTPPEEFFNLCDEMGLLVWHDFWITGDCQGTWDKGSQDYPYDARVFLSNAAAVVKKLRNHPSLLVWTAGNEGYPREEIYKPLRDKILAGLDGTRPFIPSSGYSPPPEGWRLSWPDNKAAGTYSGGPYSWVDPKEYYRLVAGGKDWLFKNEVGIPSVPVLQSLKEFLPEEPDPEVKFPLNHVWGYHDACEDNGKYSLYDAAIRRRYGEPKDLADYAFKAQLINAENYRAIFEAVNQAADRTAGVILWKGNPAWPSVSWQIYDWYLRPNAGYYFAKRACEPLHIQLNIVDGSVWAVNAMREDRSHLGALVRFYDRTFRKTGEFSAKVAVPALSSREISLAGQNRHLPDGAAFASLQLRDKGQLLSENFYWLSQEGDFGFLTSLPQARARASARREIQDGRPVIRIRLNNNGSSLAFFLALRMERKEGKEILPSFWSDNYVSLLPGESRDVTWRAGDELSPRKSLQLRLEGWNVPRQVVAVD
jgi:exo-1,4-beta-D-glucosaminidase